VWGETQEVHLNTSWGPGQQGRPGPIFYLMLTVIE
jgi:hypothetical protein